MQYRDNCRFAKNLILSKNFVDLDAVFSNLIQKPFRIRIINDYLTGRSEVFLSFLSVFMYKCLQRGCRTSVSVSHMLTYKAPDYYLSQILELRGEDLSPSTFPHVSSIGDD
jgi:hypothetical protein